VNTNTIVLKKIRRSFHSADDLRLDVNLLIILRFLHQHNIRCKQHVQLVRHSATVGLRYPRPDTNTRVAAINVRSGSRLTQRGKALATN